MHRELEWPVSKATCLYKKLYMVYSFLYTIIEGTSKRARAFKAISRRKKSRQKAAQRKKIYQNTGFR
jgi:hypothetical protein